MLFGANHRKGGGPKCPESVPKNQMQRRPSEVWTCLEVQTWRFWEGKNAPQVGEAQRMVQNGENVQGFLRDTKLAKVTFNDTPK